MALPADSDYLAEPFRNAVISDVASAFRSTKHALTLIKTEAFARGEWTILIEPSEREAGDSKATDVSTDVTVL